MRNASGPGIVTLDSAVAFLLHLNRANEGQQPNYETFYVAQVKWEVQCHAWSQSSHGVVLWGGRAQWQIRVIRVKWWQCVTVC